MQGSACHAAQQGRCHRHGPSDTPRGAGRGVGGPAGSGWRPPIGATSVCLMTDLYMVVPEMLLVGFRAWQNRADRPERRPAVICWEGGRQRQQATYAATSTATPSAAPSPTPPRDCCRPLPAALPEGMACCAAPERRQAAPDTATAGYCFGGVAGSGCSAARSSSGGVVRRHLQRSVY